MENKETYHLGNLIADCNEDIVKVRMIIKHFGDARRLFTVFSRIWSYISILLFAFYAVYQGISTEAWTVSYIIFGVCFAMLIANTALLCLETRCEGATRVRRGVMHAFHWITVALKLCMTVIVICGLVALPDAATRPVRVVICLLSVFWMGVTLTVDVLFLTFTLIGRFAVAVFEERKERVVTACVNTAKGAARAVVNVVVRKNPIAKGVRWVSGHLPRLRRKRVSADKLSALDAPSKTPPETTVTK